MKRSNEALVGVSVLLAIALVIAGSVWLSQQRFGGSDITRNVRVRSIGGLMVGDPVLLRGVGIGRVERIELSANDWVVVSLRMRGAARSLLPQHPVALFVPTTLFGDWSVQLSSVDALPADPTVRRQVADAQRATHGSEMPGAVLPDVGQLTAQASRIASDIAVISSRVSSAFDSASTVRLRNAFRDLSRLSQVLRVIAQGQESTLVKIGGNLDTGTTLLAQSAASIARAAGRVDSATSRGQLQRILSHTDTITSDLTAVSSDLRGLAGAAASQQQALASIIARTDSIVGRIAAGQGTLGKLTRDTTLYTESLQAVRALRLLLEDVQKNPRRYFQFSVF